MSKLAFKSFQELSRAFKPFVDFSTYLCDVTDWTISGSFSDEIPQVGGVMSQPD